jgi:hypothetical protein
MEQEKQHLDLRTLLVVMAENEQAPWEKIVELIADEVNVSSEKLKAVFSGASKTETRNTPTTTQERAPKDSKESSASSESKRRYSRWGDARLNELVERWNKGQKPSQIANEMGVSTQTVYQKISYLRKERDDIANRKSRNPAFSGRS